MAITAQLRTCTCTFDADGQVHVSAVVVLIDDVLGALGSRVVEITDPAIVAGVRQTALSLAPTTEQSLGVPLSLPPLPQ